VSAGISAVARLRQASAWQADRRYRRFTNAR